MKPETYSFDSSRAQSALRWLLMAVMLATGLFALAWLSATPAQARGGNGGESPGAPELPDSDNLDFAHVSGNCQAGNANQCGAADLGVPIYGYSYSSPEDACKGSGRADGFFTTADFPVASNTGNGSVAGGTCEAFVAQQRQAAAHMQATGGYYMAENSAGNLVLTQRPGGAPFWYQRTSGGAHSNYEARVDYGTPSLRLKSTDGDLGFQNVGFSIAIIQDNSGNSQNNLCVSGSHPRGEDSEQEGTDASSGRRLTSLNNPAEIRDANQWWCRTDIRYQQRFYSDKAVNIQFRAYESDAAVAAGDGARTTRQWQRSSGQALDMWGRQNCFYTALRISISGDGTTSECVYPFPLPCDDDLDGALNEGIDMFDVASWRNTRVGDIDCANPVTPGCLVPPCDAPDLTPTTTTTVPPPPGIPPPPTIPPPTTTTVPPPTSGPCDSHDFSVAENLIPTSAATPGLATPRTGADLTVISKNPNNASPPRGTSAAGCPDGHETRGAAAPTSAGYSNSAAPPGAFADYAVVRQNLAHRYGWVLGIMGREVAGENTI